MAKRFNIKESEKFVCERHLYRTGDYDCKNIFTDSLGNVLGQCGCYNPKYH